MGRTTTKQASTIKTIAEKQAQAVRSGNDANVVLPLISYYGTGRLWDIPRGIKRELKEKPSKPSRLDGYRNSVDPRCSPADFMKWLSRQEWIAFQENAEPPIYTAVKKAVVGCLEDGVRIWFSAKQEQVLVEFRNQGNHAFDQLLRGWLDRIHIATSATGVAARRERGKMPKAASDRVNNEADAPVPPSGWVVYPAVPSVSDGQRNMVAIVRDHAVNVSGGCLGQIRV